MHESVNPRWARFAAFVIFLIALTVVLFLIAPLIWSVLQIFVIAALLALALDRLVHWQVAHGIPRWAATVNLFVLLLLLSGLTLYFLIPPFIEQFQQFVASLPALWSAAMQRWSALLERYPQLADSLEPGTFISNLLRGAGSWAQAARTVFTTAVGAVTATVLILVTVFYMLLNPRPLLYGLRGLCPNAWWETLDRVAAAVAVRLRGWVIGVIVLGIIIGTLDYLALLLINLFARQDLPYILFFAILGGVLEVVPVIGPIIASVLPALVGFTIDPLLGILVLLAFFLIQQLENNIIAPVVMRHAVQLHPVSIIFALVVAAGLFGIFGAIIAVPLASVIKVLYDEWYYPVMHGGQCPPPPPREG